MRLEFKGWMTPAAVGVISFAAGTGAGYFLRKYKERSDLKEEIADTRTGVITDMEALESQFAGLLHTFEERDRKYDSHLQQAMKVITALQDVKNEFMTVISGPTQKNENKLKSVAQVESQEESVVQVETQPVPVSHIDTHPSKRAEKKVQTKQKSKPHTLVSHEVTEDNWNYDIEVSKRKPDVPYIIHRDEFFANEMDLRQSSLMYYKGDSILCDDQDVPVYNPEKVVGVLEFGKGSQDPSIVYIRNERLQAEYEVILDTGFFQIEVLGQHMEDVYGPEELKHSILKFRNSD